MALLDSFYGTTPDYLGGLLGENELNRLRGQAQDQSLMSMATALLQAGAPSRTPGGGGLAIAQGLQQGQQAYKQALNQGLQEKMVGLQLGEQMRKMQDSARMREAFPKLFNVQETPAVTEQNWSGNPEQIAQYFQNKGQAVIPETVISPAQRNVSIDTNKLQALAAMSSNPLETYATLAKLVPELRKAGFTGGQQNLENPFAVFAQDSTIPPALRQVAANYQKSYASGLIDQETADKRLADLGARVQSAQQFQQSQDALASNRQFMQSIAGQNAQNQAALVDLRKQAEANKPETFSYGQKKEFDIVQKNLASAKDAEDSAAIANRAAPLLPQAFGSKGEAMVKGVLNAVTPMNFDAKDANDKLVQYGQQLALKTPKFSGPTSDADAKRYDTAVGDLANPSKSLESKTQALKDIKELAQKAQDFASQQENYFYQNNKSLRGFKYVPSTNPFGQ